MEELTSGIANLYTNFLYYSIYNNAANNNPKITDSDYSVSVKRTIGSLKSNSNIYNQFLTNLLKKFNKQKSELGSPTISSLQIKMINIFIPKEFQKNKSNTELNEAVISLLSNTWDYSAKWAINHSKYFVDRNKKIALENLEFNNMTLRIEHNKILSNLVGYKKNLFQQFSSEISSLKKTVVKLENELQACKTKCSEKENMLYEMEKQAKEQENALQILVSSKNELKSIVEKLQEQDKESKELILNYKDEIEQLKKNGVKIDELNYQIGKEFNGVYSCNLTEVAEKKKKKRGRKKKVLSPIPTPEPELEIAESLEFSQTPIPSPDKQDDQDFLLDGDFFQNDEGGEFI